MYVEVDYGLTPEAQQILFRGAAPTGVLVRKLISRLDQVYGLGLPRWFFGYNDQGQPDIRCAHRVFMTEHRGVSPTGLRLVGVGTEGAPLVRSKAAALQAAMIKDSSVMVNMHMRSGDHQLSYCKIPSRYFIRRLVVGKTDPKSFWWVGATKIGQGGNWLDVAKEDLERLITNSLFEHALSMINECDEILGDHGERLDRQFRELSRLVLEQRSVKLKQMCTAFHKALGVTVTDVYGHAAHKASGPQGLRVMLKNVEFSMHADALGPWMVGRNQIEGMGLVQCSSRLNTAIKRQDARVKELA